MACRSTTAMLLFGLLAGGCTDSEGEADASVDAGAAPITCDVVAPTACTDDALDYDAIAPILEARCLSCHDGTMDLWPLTTYPHVAAWFAEIRAMMLTCAMPPPESGITMPTAERETLLHWIRCGFPP